MARRWVGLVVALLALGLIAPAAASAQGETAKVLIYSGTTGYRHANGGEDIADIEFHRSAECRQSCAGAEAAPHVPYEPVTEAFVRCDLGRPLVRGGPLREDVRRW